MKTFSDLSLKTRKKVQKFNKITAKMNKIILILFICSITVQCNDQVYWLRIKDLVCRTPSGSNVPLVSDEKLALLESQCKITKEKVRKILLIDQINYILDEIGWTYLNLCRQWPGVWSTTFGRLLWRPDFQMHSKQTPFDWIRVTVRRKSRKIETTTRCKSFS